MSEPADPRTPPAKPPRDAQMIVALAIVAGMVALGLGLMVTAYLLSNWTIAAAPVAAILGALAVALNTPSGVSNAIRAMKEAER